MEVVKLSFAGEDLASSPAMMFEAVVPLAKLLAGRVMITLFSPLMAGDL